jgi:hypothetical protein
MNDLIDINFNQTVNFIKFVFFIMLFSIYNHAPLETLVHGRQSPTGK